MAKVSRFATTRVSASLIADYRKNEDVKDSFYLDGRIARKREENSADITNIGEDRGFFYALFANKASDLSGDSTTAQALNKMTEAVKLSNDKIDNEINDLADCAVEVGGRATIAREGVRQSYFAGIILKEAEIAAVTRGGACAFLYRNNALYPLTTCDTEFVNADYHGNPVDHMMDFSAGIAGTIRYSNIAQVQAGDVLVLANKEVIDALGQRNLIKSLYQNDDVGEAADVIIDLAREANADDSVQILLVKIDEVIPADRTGRLNIGLFQNQNSNLSQDTTRYEPLKNLDEEGLSAATIPGAESESPTEDAAFKPDYSFNTVDKAAEDNEVILSETDQDTEDDPFKPNYQSDEQIQAPISSSSQEETSKFEDFDFSDLKEQETTSQVEELNPSDANQEDDLDDLPIFEPVVPRAKATSNLFPKDNHFAQENLSDSIDYKYQASDEWIDDDADHLPNYEDEYEDEFEDDYAFVEEDKSSIVKRNILYGVLVLICIVCIIALVRMFLTKDESANDTQMESVSSVPVIVNTTDESDIRTPVQNPATEPTDQSNQTEETSDQAETNDGFVVGNTAVVSAEVLNIRSIADPSGELVGQLIQDTEVSIIEDDADGWVKIETADGIQGYVSVEYLR